MDFSWTIFLFKLFSIVYSLPAPSYYVLHQYLIPCVFSHPVAAQFLPYHELKTTLLNWRNEEGPPLPTRLRDIAEALQSELWQRELTYPISFADEISGTVENTSHHLQAWAVDLDRKHRNGDTYVASHVVFGTVTYASRFQDMSEAFIDGTFASVPNVYGAFQLVTIKIDYNGEVMYYSDFFLVLFGFGIVFTRPVRVCSPISVRPNLYCGVEFIYANDAL